MRARLLMLLFLLNDLMSVASAADRISWADCVTEAARANAELASAREQLMSERFELRAAYGNLLPQVSTTAAAVRSGSSAASLGAQTDYGIGIQGSINLFSGFADQARVRQSLARLKSAETRLDSARAKISFDLKSTYSAFLLGKKFVAHQQEIIKRREENLKIVTLKFDSGTENRGSVLLSKANLMQAQYDALQAENMTRVARANLARVLGRDELSDIELEEEVPESAPPINPDFPLLAMQTPEYRLRVQEEASSDAALILARSAFFPTVDVTGRFGRSGSAWFPQTEGWSLGLNLSLPIFSGGRSYYGTKGASASAVSSSLLRKDSERDILARLHGAHAAFVESTEKLKVDGSFYRATFIRAEIARNKYRNGLVGFDSWDLIENDLISRQAVLLRTQKARVDAQAAWEQALGIGVIP